MLLIKKLILFLIPLAAFIYVVNFVEPPKDWISASYPQIFIFFIPLLATITFFANLFINYLPRSFLIGLSFLVLAALKALNLLNLITAALLIFCIVLLWRIFPKTHLPRNLPGLTFFTKIPKLTPMRPAEKTTRFERLRNKKK